MTIYYTKKALIKIKILLLNKILIIVFLKYFNYSNIFLTKSIAKIFIHISINNYFIILK